MFWRKKTRYLNLYQKLLNQPHSGQQGGVQYPPPASGIEVKSLEEILAPQMELVRLIEMTTETADVFERRYWPAIERYAQTVHLLPASDCNHHEGQGGLLHHGLEVGLYTMQYGQHGLYGMKMGIKKRDGRERFLFACFMAGLCHDLGKVVTDVQVTSGTGGLVWSPFIERLTEWAAHNRVSQYYADLQPNRYKLHENVTPKILNKVLTDEDCKYIAEIDQGLFNEMMLAFGPLAGPSNVDDHSIGLSGIRAMVQKADCRSVEEDKKKSRIPADLGIARPAPMARHFTDGMRRMLREGKWKINDPSGAAWVMGPDRDLYLAWPRCGMELYDYLLGEGTQGVPKDPVVIADTLAGRQVIIPASDGGHLWRIKPMDLDASLTVVRIRNDWAHDLAGLLPPGLSGLVESVDGTSLSWQYVAAGAGQEAIIDKPGPERGVLEPAPGNPGPKVEREPKLPRLGIIPPPGYGQPTEAEKPAEKGGWRTLTMAFVCVCLGYLASMGHILYLGKQLYPEYPWPFYLYGAINEIMGDGYYMRLAVLIILFFWGLGVFPLVKRIYKQSKQEAEEIKNEAREFRDGAKREAVDIVASAHREAGEFKKIAKDEAAETRIKAKQQAAEIRDRALREAEAIRKKAESEAVEVLQNAERDAQAKIAQAREKMNELWVLLKAKAIEVGLLPEELPELLKAMQKAKEEAAAIIARAQVQAKEAAEDIIAQARTQAQKESKEALHRARVEAAEIVGQALMSVRDKEQDAQRQADQQPQHDQRGHAQEEPPENEPSPDEDMDDRDQMADQVAVLEGKIWGILSSQQEMTKRDLERKGAKSYYGRLWQLAMVNLMTEGKIAYDQENKTYRCQT